MSVLKRGNRKHWYVQFQFKGKTHIRSSRTTDKRMAEQMEREWRRQLHTQEYLGNKERIPMNDILDQFIESKKGTPTFPRVGSEPCKRIESMTPADQDKFISTTIPWK